MKSELVSSPSRVVVEVDDPAVVEDEVILLDDVGEELPPDEDEEELSSPEVLVELISVLDDVTELLVVSDDVTELVDVVWVVEDDSPPVDDVELSNDVELPELEEELEVGLLDAELDEVNGDEVEVGELSAPSELVDEASVEDDDDDDDVSVLDELLLEELLEELPSSPSAGVAEVDDDECPDELEDEVSEEDEELEEGELDDDGLARFALLLGPTKQSSCLIEHAGSSSNL